MTDSSPNHNANDGSGIGGSLLLIAAGIGVFIICSIVQGAGGSSMFQSSFEDPDNVVLELLMQVTWWPGWIVTVLLVGAGILGLLSRDS